MPLRRSTSTLTDLLGWGHGTLWTSNQRKETSQLAAKAVHKPVFNTAASWTDDEPEEEATQHITPDSNEERKKENVEQRKTENVEQGSLSSRTHQLKETSAFPHSSSVTSAVRHNSDPLPAMPPSRRHEPKTQQPKHFKWSDDHIVRSRDGKLGRKKS